MLDHKKGFPTVWLDIPWVSQKDICYVLGILQNRRFNTLWLSYNMVFPRSDSTYKIRKIPIFPSIIIQRAFQVCRKVVPTLLQIILWQRRTNCPTNFCRTPTNLCRTPTNLQNCLQRRNSYARGILLNNPNICRNPTNLCREPTYVKHNLLVCVCTFFDFLVNV